jgi:hypothetical protein
MQLDAISLAIGLFIGVVVGVGLITVLAVAYGGGKE